MKCHPDTCEENPREHRNHNPWHLQNHPPPPQGWNACLHYSATSSVIYQPSGFGLHFKTSCSFFYINRDIRKHFFSRDNSWGCFSLVNSTTCQEYDLFYWRSKLRGNTYFWNKYYFLNSLSSFTTHYIKTKNKPSITSQPLQKILIFLACLVANF